MEEIAILKKAIETYGYDAQFRMLVEEIGELLDAIGKHSRGRVSKDSVLEELADVVIMCEQLAWHFSFFDYQFWRKKKIERLASKLKDS